MKINANAVGFLKPEAISGLADSKKSKALDFGKIFSNAIEAVDQTEKMTKNLDEKMILGDIETMHQLRIETMKADLTLNLAVEVRNKLLDAYNEIMRMQF